MIEHKEFICGCCDVRCLMPPGQLPEEWRVLGSGVTVCGDCAPSVRDYTPKGEQGPKPDLSRSQTSLPLRSGSYIDLADPDVSVIHPIDIAAGLRQPRYCAQTRDFYTVAQHSLLVLRLVSPLARKLGGDKGLQLRRCALMHDAAEAFIHDITTPLKQQLADYRAIEARFETRLSAHFGFEFTEFRRHAVKLADLQALAIEQRDLLGIADEWPLLDQIDRSKLQSIKITRCWHPDEAQARFLDAFEDLFPAIERKTA